MVTDVQTPVLEPGIYRIKQLSDLLGVSRTTIDRYIERFSLPLEEVHHGGKPVKGIVLDQESIEKIQTAIQTGATGASELLLNPSNTHEHPLNEQLENMRKQVQTLEKSLAVAEAQNKLMQDLLDSRASEISTLKSALMLAERHSQQRPLELTPKPVGLIGKLKSLFS